MLGRRIPQVTVQTQIQLISLIRVQLLAQSGTQILKHTLSIIAGMFLDNTHLVQQHNITPFL